MCGIDEPLKKTMIRQRVYVDTSVIGGCFDAEFAEYSKLLFTAFMKGDKSAVVSNITLKELLLAPDEVKKRFEEIPQNYVEYVALTEEAEDLAKKYIAAGIVSENYILDAEHIAIATVEKIDVLVNWNFRHIVNLKRFTDSIPSISGRAISYLKLEPPWRSQMQNKKFDSVKMMRDIRDQRLKDFSRLSIKEKMLLLKKEFPQVKSPARRKNPLSSIGR